MSQEKGGKPRGGKTHGGKSQDCSRTGDWRQRWHLRRATVKDVGEAQQGREEPAEGGAGRRGAGDTLGSHDRAFLLGNDGKIQWGHILQRQGKAVRDNEGALQQNQLMSESAAAE